MSIKEMKKEDLELLSHKDITNMILEEKGPMNTAELFKIITESLELPKSVFENKIGDYYTTLTTDKRFLILDDGKWDLRNKYTSDKIIIPVDEEEDLEEEIDLKEDSEDEVEDEDFDSVASDEEEFDDDDDDLKDLVVLDEDELEQ